MSTPLKDLVAEQMPWIFDELGFRIIEDRYDPQHFGNSLVRLACPSLLVEFIRDRGLIETTVASPANPTEWWAIDFVLEVAQGTTLPLAPLTIEAGARLLHSNFAILERAMGLEYVQVRRHLQQRRGERFHRCRDRARAEIAVLERAARAKKVDKGFSWNLYR